MIFREIKPCALLQPLVRKYLLVNLFPVLNELPVENYPTRIEQALAFFARGYIEAYNPLTNKYNRIAQNALFGQQISRLDFHPRASGDFLMVMVIFQPGTLYRLLGLPTHELTRQFCDAESVITSELQQLNDRIANCMNDYEGMIKLVENYLLQKMRSIKIDAHPIDTVSKLLLESPTRFSLAWLASQANLSPRQFERKFNERIGIGPKMYSRISRFYKALEYKESHPEVDWLSVAIQFGYSDYYHMAKDFKQFSNVTPSNMVDRLANHSGAILLDLSWKD